MKKIYIDPHHIFYLCFQICKKKSKYNSIKSPSRANLHAIKNIKSYKHLEMMNLANIKRIVDIRETEGEGKKLIVELWFVMMMVLKFRVQGLKKNKLTHSISLQTATMCLH